MGKFIRFSTALLSTLAITNMIAKPSVADHTDDGFFVCNYTSVTHGFTMVDTDYNKTKNFSLRANECWEYWEYEEIEFYDNFNNLKRYSLRENNRYIFQYNSNGAVDVLRESE
jgi:hypothetical protein